MGCDALGLAELAVGIVGTQGCPVVVGAEIDVLTAVLHQRLIERDRVDIRPHQGVHALLGGLLVSEDVLSRHIIRQSHRGGQGDGDGIDRR